MIAMACQGLRGLVCLNIYGQAMRCHVTIETGCVVQSRQAYTA